MIRPIRRVPGAPAPEYKQPDLVTPAEPVEPVICPKPETDTVEISEIARQLLEAEQRKKSKSNNEITPEEEAKE